MSEDRLFIRQLKAGREFAKGDVIAKQMANFVYLIGDRVSRECLVVDPAWDVQGIVDAASAEDMRITGALVTHFHPDHIGGTVFGHDIQGLAELMAINPCKVHIHGKEVEGVRQLTGISTSDIVAHSSGDVVKAGEVEVECLHTPGHTPGSQCFRCKGALISGDTLFLQGCGRVDLPGGDSDEMYRTLSQRLSTLPGDLTLYPGHDYGSHPHATLDAVRRSNPVLQVPDLETWRRQRG